MKVPKNKAELREFKEGEILMILDAKWAFDHLIDRTPIEGIELDSYDYDDIEGFSRYKAASDVGYFLGSKLLSLVCEGIRDPRDLAMELLDYFLLFTTLPKTMEAAQKSAPPLMCELLTADGWKSRKAKA